jgi:hypothetical protein|tara:strand:- start:72 stop:248 length:177 start_codon:yes stop_codon:yes gene_type:complete
MTNREIETLLKTLEHRLIDIDEKLMGHMAVSKDRYMLTNDRINEAFDVIKMIEREGRQ